VTVLPPDTYVQRTAPDPVLDPATVLRIVRQHVRGAAAVTAVDETGGEARTYMVDDGIVLKTQRPQQLRERTSLEKETFFLNALAAASDVRVPRVLGYGRDGDVEYICMSRMPGVAARTVTIEGAARAALLRELGGMLLRIHALPRLQFFDHPLFPGPRSTEAFEERLRAGFERAVETIERDPTVWGLAEPPRAIADRVIATQRGAVDLVALHSNPGPEHVFVDPATLRLTGIIDFGDAYIAHPAFDMRWPRPEDRDALLAGYTEERRPSEMFLAAWRASQVLADMTVIATRPDRRDATTQTLVKLAADL
jgi:aminoglycoside phosphotransferase (APT) family kinase protein